MEIRLQLILILFLTACNTQNNQIPKKSKIPKETIFENGDIIFRKGNGYLSNFFKNHSKKEKRFSHVGIISKNKYGSFLVIHAEANEFNGIGYVKKERIEVFLEKVDEWAVYRLKTDTSTILKVLKTAKEINLQKVPFDVKFDSEDTTAFYCTELISHCLKKGFGCELLTKLKTSNEKTYITLDDLYFEKKWIYKIFDSK